jgi:hypothetical protein
MNKSEQTSRRIKVKISTVVVLASLLMVGSGCAINQEPFKKFSTATTITQTGTENCMSLAYDFARSDFSESFIADSDSKFSSLQISTLQDDKTTLTYGGMSDEQPLFASIIQARTALQKLNVAFSSYASLLQILAGTKSLSSDELKALSTNANAAAAKALNLSGESVPAETGQLIGSAFSMSADLYVKNRIKSNLRDAINGNQTQVKKYAAQGIKLVSLLREALKRSYVNKFKRLHVKWNKAKRAKKTKENTKENTKEKTQLLATTLAMNSKYTGSFEVLSALDRVYELLPKANSDLAKSVDDSDAALPWLSKLSNVSADLKILNSNLSTMMAKK